jgi:hypothetical protein
LLDGAIALGLIAILVAAIVNVIESGSSEEPVRATGTTEAHLDEHAPGPPDADELPEQLPALIPLPGQLREAGGTLWWSSVDCRAGILELGSGAVARVPGEHCRIWPSLDGSRAVALSARRSDALDGRGLVYLVPANASERVVAHTPGTIGSEVAWSPDESSFAVCLATREGTVVDVLRFLPGGPESLPGGCFPAWLGDGRLALAFQRPVSVRVGETQLLGPEDAAQLLPSVPEGSEPAVSALFGLGDHLVVGLAVVSPVRLLPAAAAVVVLGAGGIEFQARLTPAGTLPAVVGLSPTGDALWYLDASENRAVLLSVPGGRRLLTNLQARWIAWSPGGRYLAAASELGIRILTWPGGEELVVVPVDASSVAWTAGS